MGKMFQFVETRIHALQNDLNVIISLLLPYFGAFMS